MNNAMKGSKTVASGKENINFLFQVIKIKLVIGIPEPLMLDKANNNVKSIKSVFITIQHFGNRSNR